jgi:hypothetical protein
LNDLTGKGRKRKKKMALKLKEKMREEIERETKKKTRCHSLIETLIVIATRQQESSSRDEANDTKKDHC